jgi:DNA polymerase I-like protein with 3'-5' exonuclease and polymerase domains
MTNIIQQKVSIRYCCRSKPGTVWASLDYSGQELAVAAALSSCRSMLEVFLAKKETPYLLNDQGELILRDGKPIENPRTDLHLMAASYMFPQMKDMSPEEVRIFGNEKPPGGKSPRQIGKILNFALIYGMAAPTLAEKLGIKESQAQRFIDLYFAGYPELRAWLTNASNHGGACGYVVNPQGLLMFVAESNAKGVENEESTRRKAANALVQSTSAQMCKLALIDIDEKFMELDAEYPGQIPAQIGPPVHDEINLYVPGDWQITERVEKGMRIQEGIHVDEMIPTGPQEERARRYVLVARKAMQDAMCELLDSGIRAAFPERPDISFPSGVDVKVNRYWEH